MHLDKKLGHSAEDRAEIPGTQPVANRNIANISPQVAQCAVEWLIELQAADADEAIYAAFQQWRAAHPDYEFAWQHIEAMNTRFNGLASPLGSAVARAVLTSHRSLKRRQIIKTLVVILFLVVPAGGLKRKFPGVHGWPMNGLMSVSSATLH